jgi:hypothetical protein
MLYFQCCWNKCNKTVDSTICQLNQIELEHIIVHCVQYNKTIGKPDGQK